MGSVTYPSRPSHPSHPAPDQGEGELKPITQKPPLSDYDKALLEGKSHLEAMYAQFTPTPEELERRKRENESLRRASDPASSVPQLSTHPTPCRGEAERSRVNYQQYYGPCPAPYTWQGFRPLDPWKVHTS